MDVGCRSLLAGPNETPVEYISVTVDGICRGRASRRSAGTTFKFNIKQNKVSRISIIIIILIVIQF
jgi:hypothetical protein